MRKAVRSKVLGVVAARKGSQRFPNKHHAMVLGRPLLAYVLEAAVAARRLDRLVISTDDLSLRLLAEAQGIEFLERPKRLAQATSALDDAIRHACRHLEERDGFAPDLVVAMQGNLPIRKAGQIDEVVGRLEALPTATSVCTAGEVRIRPEWAKVLLDEKSGAVAPYIAGSHPFRKQEFPKLYMVDGAVMAVRRDVLFETDGNRAAHAWLGERLHIVPQTDPMYSLEVDYPDEVPLVEYHLLRVRRGDRSHRDLAHREG